MNWIIAPIIALFALGVRRATASRSAFDLPGWTRLDAVPARDVTRSWGAAGDALRAELVRTLQPAVTDGVLMVRQEWSGGAELHVLYKKL